MVDLNKALPRRLRRPFLCALAHNNGLPLMFLFLFVGLGIGLLRGSTSVFGVIFLLLLLPFYVGWATSSVVLHEDHLVTGSILRRQEYHFADVIGVQEGDVPWFRGMVPGIELKYSDNTYKRIAASAFLGDNRRDWIDAIQRAVRDFHDLHGEPEIREREFTNNVSLDRLRRMVQASQHGSTEHLLRRLKKERATSLTCAKLLHQVKGGTLAEWKTIVAESDAYAD